MRSLRSCCAQVREARPLLEDAEAERMFPPEQLVKEAITATEQDGIVFIASVPNIRLNSRQLLYSSELAVSTYTIPTTGLQQGPLAEPDLRDAARCRCRPEGVG